MQYPRYFYLKIDVFQIAQKVSKYFGYFWKDIGYQELSEIAQSAHTGGEGVWERERENQS